MLYIILEVFLGGGGGTLPKHHTDDQEQVLNYIYMLKSALYHVTHCSRLIIKFIVAEDE